MKFKVIPSWLFIFSIYLIGNYVLISETNGIISKRRQPKRNDEYKNHMPVNASWFTCQLCSAAISLMRLYPSIATVQTVFNQICSIGYEEYDVCNGLSELFGEEIIYILTRSNLVPSEICGLVIASNCMTPKHDYPYGEKWFTKLLPIDRSISDALKALELEQLDSLEQKPQNLSPSILHLSDIHLDRFYEANSSAACKEPLCCRRTSRKSKYSHPAGLWGSFDNCDSVLRTIESLLMTISKKFSDKYRYVLLTGDYLPHDIWNTSREEVITTTRLFNKLVRKYFPSDKIIIPVIGNHEGHPVDQFCPKDLNEQYSTQWLYEELLEQWKDWIPIEYHNIFRKYGYYSRTIDTVRFVVLNTNYCARLNFWNILRYHDQGDMLEWLQKELQNATLSKQSVFIVGHIVPDDDSCYLHWVLAYRNILQIYHPIIRGQFFGHTHYDEFRIFYSSRLEPISMAYLAPSVTTYLNVNPAFRFYQTDPKTFELLDHQTYFFDVNNSTLGNDLDVEGRPKQQPLWQYEYSARDAYGLQSLQPLAWHNFTMKAMNNETLLRLYYKHIGRFSDEQVAKTSMASMVHALHQVFVQV
ncbi:Sphingomyelin phosphodiesterase [Sarcoptes scabiei]|uniref:Sphingomyelin phosphodiesterase n=1 Tax=Sarcoptes scabiei TaxID=52283 RepID=A0A834RIY6_SARSC|nr:Sphingomyelin phosphodiesterase [Sarcoptes scabiei]